jgi:EmrB/QacA subfamily drug resistance transporter
MSAAAPESPPRGAVILATLILGAAVANMNLSVANVALPTIGRDLEASQVSLNLVAVGFTLGLAASVLYLGAVADRYGRRLMLIGGLALSIPMALLAAFAPSIEILVIARVGGGIAAGMAFPVTLSIVVALFRGQTQTRAIAMWTGIGCGASALGPAIAGYLLEQYGWGSAFSLTVPIAVVAFVLALVFIPRSLGEETRPVDHLGGVLSVLAIGLLTLGLHFVSVPANVRFGLIVLLASAVGFVLFFWRQRRAPNPLFDLAIASRRIFWVAALTGLIVFGTLIGSMFIGQQYVQNVLGYSTFEAGVAALPLSITMVLVSPLAARMIRVRGSRYTMAVGVLIVLIGIALMFTWHEGASYWPVGIAYGVIGIGIGLSGTPASRSIMAAVPAHRAGMGSGMTDLQRDLGAAVMQSILAIFLTREYTSSVDTQLAALPPDQRSQISEETASILQDSFGGAEVLAQKFPQYSDAIIEGARQAFIAGSGAAIAVAIIAVAIGLLVTWFGFPRKQQELDLEAEYAKET